MVRKNSEKTRTSRHLLELCALRATEWTGRSSAFVLAVTVVIVWLVSGPFLGFSDAWQLTINTGTTIVTFLMVFLIQRAQNKDSRAIHAKLNEIVASMQGASNRLIDAERMSEDDLEVIAAHFEKLAALAKRDRNLLASHSIEEAASRHRQKKAS